MKLDQAGSCLSGVVFFLLMVVWWGETCCAPNSLDFGSCYMPIGARLDHGPGAGNNRTTFRFRDWILFLINCFGFLVCHQLVPHLVPNFPRVPLRNVSWGLGVCTVLVRSVSPCRLVQEVRLFPSPPALFLAVCPSCVRFFLPLAFQGFPGSAGCVCVCNIWIDVKLPSFFFPLLPFSNNAGGLEPICLSSPTKLWHFGGWVVWSTTCTCNFVFSISALTDMARGQA